jgi:hypothetical protein
MQRVIDLLIQCFEYDVAVFSQPWLYVLFFPALFYLAFFCLKWLVLTAPLWLPLSVFAHALRRDK